MKDGKSNLEGLDDKARYILHKKLELIMDCDWF
jgi:hypothetical protein